MLLTPYAFDWVDPGSVLNEFLSPTLHRMPWATHPLSIPASYSKSKS